jgi:hypothetical protein
VVPQDPVLQGDSLTYTVKVLQGDIPAKGADVSVFIDIIGMPLTRSRSRVLHDATTDRRSIGE